MYVTTCVCVRNNSSVLLRDGVARAPRTICADGSASPQSAQTAPPLHRRLRPLLTRLRPLFIHGAQFPKSKMLLAFLKARLTYIETRKISNPKDNTNIRQLQEDTVKTLENKLRNYKLGMEEATDITLFLSSTTLLDEDSKDACLVLVQSAETEEQEVVAQLQTHPAAPRFQQVKNFENYLNRMHWSCLSNTMESPANKIYMLANHMVNLHMFKVAEVVWPKVVACLIGGQDGFSAECFQEAGGQAGLDLVLQLKDAVQAILDANQALTVNEDTLWEYPFHSEDLKALKPAVYEHAYSHGPPVPCPIPMTLFYKLSKTIPCRSSRLTVREGSSKTSESDLVQRFRALLDSRGGTAAAPQAAFTTPPPLLALPPPAPPSAHNAADAPRAGQMQLRGSVPQTEGAQPRALADGGSASSPEQPMEKVQPMEQVQSIICK